MQLVSFMLTRAKDNPSAIVAYDGAEDFGKIDDGLYFIHSSVVCELDIADMWLIARCADDAGIRRKTGLFEKACLKSLGKSFHEENPLRVVKHRCMIMKAVNLCI